MSPLACSLLALTALLAAADALIRNPCRTKRYGGQDDWARQVNLPRIHFPPGGGIVKADKDGCGTPCFSSVYKVTACNNVVGYAPSISKVDEYSFHIKCADGCNDGGYVDIVEKCTIID